MFDFLNRRDVFLHKEVPHNPKDKKHALEESNTIVVQHKKRPLSKRIKKMFRGQSKSAE